MVEIKNQKNQYRRLNTALQIAEAIGSTRQNIDKTYFNQEKPQKHNMGKALDIGVFVMRHGVTIEELVFMVDFIKAHKEFVKSKICYNKEKG